MGVLGTIVMVAVAVQMVAGSKMSVRISQPDAESYHRQDMKKGEFDYGYHVQTVSDQFQHKVKGPDDVTYGCYGYIDPSNRKHLVYYVADRLGYRIIFPNRPTKIFTARLSDSLNKLDGATKASEPEEKVVEWNNLYLPESCFRLDEILSTKQETVQPGQPELRRPSQYTIPTTPRTTQDLIGAGSNPQGSVYEEESSGYGQDGRGGQGNYYQPQQPQRPQQPQYPQQQPQQPQYPQQQPQQPQYPQQQPQQPQQPQYPQQQPQQPQQPQPPVWIGSLPDINPADINLDQFGGLVNPILPVPVTEQNTQGIPGGQYSFGQYGLNITQLFAQIHAVNSQVVTLNMLLAGMANNPTAFANANESSCRSVIQLLQTQQRTPQLLYVPILIPYTEGQYNVNQPIAASHSRQSQKQQPSYHY